jgi:hypothetical protein
VQVRVIWPDGRSEQWSGVAPDAYTTVRQGTGTAAPTTGTR